MVIYFQVKEKMKKVNIKIETLVKSKLNSIELVILKTIQELNSYENHYTFINEANR